MKIDKGKKQKEVMRYMVKPQYGQYLGVVVKKDTDIEDEEIVDEEGYKAIIQQKIKGLEFTTETKVENTMNETDTVVETKIVSKLREGQVLIWYPGKGYVVPSTEFETVKEIKENLEILDFEEEK